MKTLIRFIKRYHFILLFLLLEGIAILLLSRSRGYQGDKMWRFFTETSGRLFGGFNNLTDYFNLRENNKQLAAENTSLKRQIAESYTIYDRKVFFVLDTVYRQQYDYINSKIISNSVTKRNNYLWLNKGHNQSVREGMAVISPSGIVGVVKITSRNFSSVLSVLHSDSRISAKVKRGNYTGTVVWPGEAYNKGSLIDVPSHFDVRVGDTIVTTGYSLDFPEGILVGIVDKVKTEANQSFHDIDIVFSTNFNTIDNVYVVRNLSKDELNSLQQKQDEDDE